MKENKGIIDPFNPCRQKKQEKNDLRVPKIA
jgi:hypothetical protein